MLKLIDVNVKNKTRNILILDDDEKFKRAELKDKITKYIEFPKSVFSFIKGRYAKQAVEIVENNIECFKYFIKCDVKNFYASIDIDILLEKLSNLIYDEPLVNQIRHAITEEKDQAGIEGLSQGSPLSPILSNVYLINFDRYFEKKENIKYVRFCDDMMFLSNEANLQEIEEKLSELKLTLSEEKTFIGKAGDRVKFLGMEIEKKGCKFDYLNEIIKEHNKEKFIKVINSLNEDDFGYNKENDLKEIINTELGTKYYALFRYIVFKENKDNIIENLVRQSNYKTAYEFEDLVSKLRYEQSKYNNFEDIFVGRNGEFYVSKIGQPKEYIKVSREMETSDIHKHIDGEESVAIRLDREDGKSRILVFDIDSSDEDEALAVAKNLKLKIEQLSYNCYLEYSGMKGYHVWIFFEEFIPVKDLNVFAEKVIDEIEFEGFTIEIIPKFNYISETQNIIKLPLGIHPETLKRCEFIDLISLDNIKFNKFIDCSYIEKTFEKVKEKFPYCYKIIEKCSVMRYIIERGINKGEMSHFDRLLILYVMSHVQQGEEFIHFIMEYTNNYSYNITEKFINKAPDNPISCRKIREYFKNTEIILNCNCSFALEDNYYATPVLHSGDSEFNRYSIENSVRETLKKLMELKDQKKELDKKISSLDKKLNSLFNSLNEDEIAIDIGKLKRIRNEDDNKWIIEINL